MRRPDVEIETILAAVLSALAVSIINVRDGGMVMRQVCLSIGIVDHPSVYNIQKYYKLIKIQNTQLV